MNKKIKFLKFQLGTAIFALVTVLVSGFFVFGPEFSQIVRALSGNYDKRSGDTLTINDWNDLDDDFVAKSGDTMMGALTVPNATVQTNLTVNGKITTSQTLGTDADNIVATKKYVDDNAGAAGAYVDESGDTMTGVLNMGDNRISNLGAPSTDGDAVSRGVMNSAIAAIDKSIEDTSGNDLKILCGKTVDTAWYADTAPNTIGVDASFSPGFFTATPQILTSLGGTNYQFKAIGGSNIYFASPLGFTVFVTHLDESVNTTSADTWNWYVNWCAFGQ